MPNENRKFIRVGVASLHYSEHKAGALEKTQFTILDAYGKKVTWDVGRLTREIYDLQLKALEVFNDVGEEILKIGEDKDLNRSAIERRGKEKIDQVIEKIVPMIKTVGENMERIATTVPKGLFPVSPREPSDVVGFLNDQEIRALVRSLPNDQLRTLLQEAREGKHREISEAILRANPLMSGVSSLTHESLEVALIASGRDKEIATLREVLALYDDVMGTASDACVALCQLVDNSGGYVYRFQGWRDGCVGSEDLRTWLSTISTRKQIKEEVESNTDEEGDENSESDHIEKPVDVDAA